MIDLCRPFLAFHETYFEGIVNLDRDPARWHVDHGDKKGRGEEDFDMAYDGWGRGMCYDSYAEGETWTWKYRTPGVSHVGVTNETIHASARERWTTSRVNGLKTGPPVWEPHSLKGFKPTTGTGTGDEEVSWQWVKENHGFWKDSGDKPLVIPEEPLPLEITIDGLSVRSFESMLRSGLTK